MSAPLALTALDGSPEVRTIYAGSSSGLFTRSGDEAGWAPVDIPGVNTATVTALTAVLQSDGEEQVVFAGVNGGIVRLRHGDLLPITIPLASPPPLVTCFSGRNAGGSVTRLLAGTLEDGVYWSNDTGRTWAPANTGLLDMSVYALVCTPGPNGSDIAFAGTETGVFLSANGGRTWRETGFDAGEAPVQAIVCAPASDLVIAGTGGAGLFRTTPEAEAWTAIGADIPARHVIALHLIEGPGAAPAVVAVFDGAIAISLNRGSDWRSIDLALDADVSIVSSCLIGRSRPNAGLAIGLSSGEIRIIQNVLATGLSS